MSELTPDIAADVVAACQTGAEEAAGALSRGLDGEFAIEVGEAATFDPGSLPDGFDGPGLLLKMVIGEVAAVVALPESTGLLPDWYTAPDATGESKLATLGQELGMLLLPESLFAEDFGGGAVANIGEALSAGGVAEGAGLVPLTLTAGEQSGAMTLLWPAASHGELIKAPEASPAEEPASDGAEATAPTAEAAPQPVAPPRLLRDFRDLPGYARSLLNVQVPLMVTLAEKREHVGEIIDLGPGSILTFDQPCDGPLQIEVGGRPVATGDAVKVGEKFGVRVREMILPGEKFKQVRPAG